MKVRSLILFLCVGSTQCLKIDRVILSATVDERYIEYWPVVARAWHDLIGARATLALISERRDIPLDTTFGDILYIDPIPGLAVGLHARMIRLLLPAYFENDVCLFSDIDMIPINRSFFIDNIKDIADDCVVVYNNRAYNQKNSLDNFSRVPMSYVAAKGSVFQEIFKAFNVCDVVNLLKTWGKTANTASDEMTLMACLKNWPDFKKRCVLLNYRWNNFPGFQRLRPKRPVDVNDGGKIDLEADKQLLKNGSYIDFHLHRISFTTKWQEIKRVTDALGMAIDYQQILQELQLLKPYYKK